MKNLKKLPIDGAGGIVRVSGAVYVDCLDVGRGEPLLPDALLKLIVCYRTPKTLNVHFTFEFFNY